MTKLVAVVITTMFIFFAGSLSFIISNITLAVSVDAASRGHGSIRNSGHTKKYKKGSSKRVIEPRKTTKPRAEKANSKIGAPVTKRGPAKSTTKPNIRDVSQYRHRNDARRDYYRYRNVNHNIRLGARFADKPRLATTVIVDNSIHYYWGGVFYKPVGSQYVVVAPFVGSVVYAVPKATTIVYVDATPYYYYGGAYYVTSEKSAEVPNLTADVRSSADGGLVEVPSMIEGESSYEVVTPPTGAVVPYLPEEAAEELAKGKRFYVYDGTYYRPFSSEGEIVYMVVENPNS